jgi:hypothetical protein
VKGMALEENDTLKKTEKSIEKQEILSKKIITFQHHCLPTPNMEFLSKKGKSEKLVNPFYEGAQFHYFRGPRSISKVPCVSFL